MEKWFCEKKYKHFSKYEIGSTPTKTLVNMKKLDLIVVYEPVVDWIIFHPINNEQLILDAPTISAVNELAIELGFKEYYFPQIYM